MELVTLAHVTFNRVGSASHPGMTLHNEIHRVREVRDEQEGTLGELVVDLAVELGETRESLNRMWQENASMHYAPQRGAIVFNIHGPNTQYGSPYAVCYAHPALKIDDRYFKLEEVVV
jgi:hypothetical protein